MSRNFDDLWNDYCRAQSGAREVRDIGGRIVKQQAQGDGLYYVDRTPWDRRTLAVIRWRGAFYQLEMPEMTPTSKLRSIANLMDLAVSMRPLLRVELAASVLR